MGLTWEDLGGGYLKVHNGLFTLNVVELDVASPAEGDDLLHSFRPRDVALARGSLVLDGAGRIEGWRRFITWSCRAGSR
jgi:hypothetical protein